MKIKNKKMIITLICILFVSVVILMLLLCQLKKNKSQDTNVSESLPQTEFETETEIESEIIDTHEGQAKSLLTGEWIDETLARKRPISIMVENTSACLPRYGLSRADVIYECPVEGGSTRYMVLFQDYSNMEKIGNIRSCRHYYAYFAHEYESVYLHAGASYIADDGVLAQHYIDDVDAIKGKADNYFYRDSSEHKAPHNLYTSSDKIAGMFAEYGYDEYHSENYQGNFKFANDDESVNLDNGTDAVALTMYYPINKPWFVYNAEDGLYYRYQFKDKETDGIDNSQVCVKNIIIMNCAVSEVDSSSGLLDVNQLSGGSGYFITNGKCIDITWSRTSYDDITHYYDLNGNEITLNQGKTWIEVGSTGSASKNVIYSTMDEFNNR